MQSVTNNTVQHILNGAGGEQARVYLNRARLHADYMNAAADENAHLVTVEERSELARTNALVALACALVPAESAVLKG